MNIIMTDAVCKVFKDALFWLDDANDTAERGLSENEQKGYASRYARKILQQNRMSAAILRDFIERYEREKNG